MSTTPDPIPLILTCPMCNGRHIDKGEFATKPHHTHACQHCGHVWRPAIVPKHVAFQERVKMWLHECFGAEIAADKKERNHRFIEEALELVQACGCTKEDVLMLVDYVFNRPVGERIQEIGGVMTTLAALCATNKEDMQAAAEAELQRVWIKMDQIRTKQAGKPRDSVLPQHVNIVEELLASGHKKVRMSREAWNRMMKLMMHQSPPIDSSETLADWASGVKAVEEGRSPVMIRGQVACVLDPALEAGWEPLA